MDDLYSIFQDCVYVCVCNMHMRAGVLRPKEAIGSPGAGVTGSCEPLSVGAGISTQSCGSEGKTWPPKLWQTHSEMLGRLQAAFEVEKV